MNSQFLVPYSYNIGIGYDNFTGKVSLPNIDTDTVNFFPDISVKEAFQWGYGDMCFILDETVDAINKQLGMHY